MKKKTFLLATLSVLAAGTLAVGLAGCGYSFKEYSFEGGAEEKNWRDLEYPDTNIEVDGVVNASEYGDGYLSFSDVNDVNMKVYAHMGEEGVFFGFVSDDKNVNYNPRNAVYNNTSVEIQVAPFGTTSLNVNAIQLRLGADGTTEQWVGFRSEDGYTYSKKYIPEMGAVHVNGELNGEADGYSAEIYVRYAALGLSEKPGSVICAPSFNTLPDVTNSTRATWTLMLGCNLDNPSTWYVVDGTGMTGHTAGFTSNEKTAENDKGGNEFYYFGSAPQKAYSLKANVSVVGGGSNGFLNNDQYPKFGLVNKSEHALQSFHIDAAERKAANFGTVRAVQTTRDGTDWQWNTNASTSMADHWGKGKIEGYSSIPLQTIYYGGDLYFVLDGVLVKTVHGFADPSEGAIPGFMCFNTMAKYSAIEYETDEAKVAEEVAKYLAKDRKIDGDLSDWTDEAVNLHYKEVSDPNGNKMKVRSFRGQDGLYLAYEVHHLVNAPVTKWDDAWWENTNIEFFVDGGAENRHYALTAFGTSGYMDAVMTTVRNEERQYDTVGEIFVPFASLEKDGFDTDGELKVGFAFKAKNNDEAGALLGGTNWWSFAGDPKENQLRVAKGGIGEEYVLTYKAGAGEGEDYTESVFGGDTVVLKAPTAFTKEGYRFLNWSDGSRRYAAGDPFVMPDGPAELTAMWISLDATGTYHVTYQKGDGDVTGDLPADTNEYAPGDRFDVAEQGNLARAGYRFMGWTDGESMYEAGGKGSIGEDNVELTAVWAQEYTLSYDLGGTVSGNAPEGGKYIEGEQVDLSADLPSSAEYDFFGWTFEGKTYSPDAAFEMPAKNVEFVAAWKPKVKTDGSLSDWEALESKTLSSHAPAESDKREATWYGVIRNDGLYLAAELWHNKTTVSGKTEWYNNFNFEIRLNDGDNANHYYVYIASGSESLAVVRLGRDAGSTDGVEYKYTHEAGTAKGTEHHSVFEVFIPIANFRQLMKADGSLTVGLALKTGDYNNGDAEKIPGGSVNYSGDGDTWYAPYGVWPDDPSMFATVTREGLYLSEEYAHPDWKFGADSAAEDHSITVDGVLTDWAGDHTLGIRGTDLYDGKSVTFHGKLTKEGLYLAAEAYHSEFVESAGAWYDHTNLELRIGRNWGGNGNKMPTQFWVHASAGGCTVSASGMQAKLVHETVTGHGTADEHTVIEVFIPYSVFLGGYDYMVKNGSIQVGVAWKTNGDGINNAALGDGDPWWMPKNEHIENNPAVVDGTGIYTAAEFAAKQA